MARILNPYPYAVSYRRSPVQAHQPIQETEQETESLELQERRQFYSRYGKPELAERYGVFEVPEGLSVKSISETEKGLQVTFYDPVATSMYLEKGRESREFFTSIGYAKYGGKYAPFDIPEGHRVGEITETSEGLQVTFATLQVKMSLNDDGCLLQSRQKKKSTGVYEVMKKQAKSQSTAILIIDGKRFNRDSIKGLNGSTPIISRRNPDDTPLKWVGYFGGSFY